MGFKKKYKKDESIQIIVSKSRDAERLEAQAPAVILDTKTGLKLAECQFSVSIKLYSVDGKRFIGEVNDISQLYSLIFKNKHVLKKDFLIQKRINQLKNLSFKAIQTIKKPFTIKR